MSERTEIQVFLNEVSPRALKGNLSSTEASRLIKIVMEHCILDAALLLIRAARADKDNKHFEKWTTYYERTIEREKECWNNSDMIRILSLGVELYGYDERDNLAWEAASDLYRRAPNSWDCVQTYLSEGRRILQEDQYVEILDRLIELKPSIGSASYTIALYFEFLWRRYPRDKYRQLSLQYYQEALSLNLREKEPHLAALAERAFNALSDG